MGRTRQMKRKVNTMEQIHEGSAVSTGTGINGPKPKEGYTKLLVVCHVDIDREPILNKIQESLGHPVKFFCCTTSPHRMIEGFNLHTFYVNSLRLAESIAVLNCLGPTSSISLAKFSGNPSQSPLTDEVKEKLKIEILSRFNEETGHLDLSDFAASNSLIRDYFFPVHKYEVRCVIDEIIVKYLNHSKVKSIDLSHNKLNNFTGFGFLNKFDYTVLHVNDNEFGQPSVFKSIKATPVTELTARNNHFNTEPNGERSPPINYLPELLGVFPNLVTLDSRPISEFKLELPSWCDLEPPCKIPKPDPCSSGLPPPSSSSSLPLSTIKIEPSDDKTGTIIGSQEPEQTDSLTTNHQNPPSSSSSQAKNNNNTTDPLVTYLEKRVTTLENQLTDSTTKISMLATVLSGLSEFKRTAVTDLHQLKEENSSLKDEIGRLKQQQLQCNGIVQKLKEQHFHNGVEIQKLRDQHQKHSTDISRLRNQQQHQQQPPPPPSRSLHHNAGPSSHGVPSSYVPTRPSASALPQQSRSYNHSSHYDSRPMPQQRQPTYPSSTTSNSTNSSALDDLSHLFDRPRRS